MGKTKKKTKPITPGKKKAALALAKIRIHKYKNRYATLWEAAKELTGEARPEETMTESLAGRRVNRTAKLYDERV